MTISKNSNGSNKDPEPTLSKPGRSTPLPDFFDTRPAPLLCVIFIDTGVHHAGTVMLEKTGDSLMEWLAERLIATAVLLAIAWLYRRLVKRANVESDQD